MTDLDRAILDLEKHHWQFSGVKEQAIRARTGLSPVGYYQRLNALLDLPAAEAHDPHTVRRLRRLREKRAALRRVA